MNLLKYSLIGIACNLAVTPDYAMDVLSTTQPLEHVNHSRIATAKKACARETAWAKPVRYALAGTTAAIAVYSLYKMFKPTALTLSPELIAQRNNMTTEEWKGLKLMAQKRPLWTVHGMTDLADLVLTNVTYYLAIGALINNVPRAFASLPTAGTLTWFVQERTEYQRNMSDLKRYITYPIFFQQEIQDVENPAQLIVLDIEKIVAYLQNFAQKIETENMPAYLIGTCNRYQTNLENLANTIIDHINANRNAAPQKLQELGEILHLLDTEVTSAQDFVSANYR